MDGGAEPHGNDRTGLQRRGNRQPAGVGGVGSPATLSTTVNVSKSGWLAARRMGSSGHVVHTAAVFITVDGLPVRASASDAEFYVEWTTVLQKTSPGGVWNWYFPTSLAAAQVRYQSAMTKYQQIAQEAGPPPPATEGTIFTTQTPTSFDNDWDYELGTAFWADVAGQVTQVRLYTNTLEGGNHTVRIWRGTDNTLVAGPYHVEHLFRHRRVRTFTLPAPVDIAANTPYIVAISTSSNGSYAVQRHGFDTTIVNGHLHTYVGSGLWTEKLGTMPLGNWQNSNYFRDIVFVPKQ